MGIAALNPSYALSSPPMNLTHIKYLSLFALLVNAAAMLSPIINGGDSITYAALSQYIALNNDWANLMLDGKDWLDKPHMPFWITAVFFQLFGVSALSYILPGFLFHVIGGFFTYRLARLFYSREAAWLSVLVYVSVFHLMDSSIEVKAETYLTGFIMGACYYWLRYDAQSRLKYLLLGAAFTAGAVMTKGVFTMITITSGLVILWLYQKQWSKLWSVKWWLAFALSLLFTAPEVIALYLQFDAHPEKLVFGRTEVSGIRFFLWDSQFGRFLNTGPIKNTNGHPFYFVLVFLWAFLPWVAVFFAAMAAGVRRFAQRQVHENTGFVFLCGAFFITFGLFSATSFQLDHYTVILFPFAAILCGKLLADRLANLQEGRALMIAQVLLTALLLTLAIGLSLYVGNAIVLVVLAVVVLLMLGYAVANRQHAHANALLVFPLFGILALYIFLVLTTALTFTRVSVAYNAGKQLASQPNAPVYVYQMDIVARELGLYQLSSAYAVETLSQLPQHGSYFLLVSAEQLAEVAPHLASTEQVGQGNWVVHKTGTFPRLLRLAKGAEPLQDIRILQIGSMN
ncbi:MAG: glycosyltransferase family 39 protein [Sideroxydans sp.]|jgi:4-amino-4-deoxy-L-arabinose transferase-like glycosyltransferase